MIRGGTRMETTQVLKETLVRKATTENKAGTVSLVRYTYGNASSERVLFYLETTLKGHKELSYFGLSESKGNALFDHKIINSLFSRGGTLKELSQESLKGTL